MFGVSGRIRAVVMVSVEIIIGKFLFGVRHFMGVSVVCGGRVIEDMYISCMYTYRLSRDVMAISVASGIILLEVILFKISHFGMNPDRGGSPPRESIVVDRAIMVWGVFVHMVPRSLMVIDSVLFISKSVGMVAVV